MAEAMTRSDPHFPRAGHPCHGPDANSPFRALDGGNHATKGFLWRTNSV